MKGLKTAQEGSYKVDLHSQICGDEKHDLFLKDKTQFQF